MSFWEEVVNALGLEISPEIKFAIEFDELMELVNDDELDGRIDGDTRYFETPSGNYYE